MNWSKFNFYLLYYVQNMESPSLSAFLLHPFLTTIIYCPMSILVTSIHRALNSVHRMNE